MRLLNEDILAGNAARSDMVIAIGPVRLYFVKRSMRESVAMLPLSLKTPLLVRV